MTTVSFASLAAKSSRQDIIELLLKEMFDNTKGNQKP
jgi:hypothetical protein